MDQKLYTSIMNDLIASKGPVGPTKNLVRNGMAEDKAKVLVMEVYKDLKWQMRKHHLWKVIGSGVVLSGLIAVYLTTGRLFVIWLPIAAIAFLYSLIQFTFAIGVDVGE